MKNSIGYVEYAYAKQNKMSHTALKNAAGNIVQPSAETFAAAGDIDWSQQEGFYKVITNSETDQAWPIAAATFILVHKQPENPQQVAGVLNFFDWAYTQGDDSAMELDYVPFSDTAVALFKEKHVLIHQFRTMLGEAIVLEQPFRNGSWALGLNDLPSPKRYR